MVIDAIELENYRNYEKLRIELSEGTNILYGDNAQGKTNLLEAVFMALTTKSHKLAKDKDVILFGRDEAHIKVLLKKKEVPHRIDMHLKKAKPKGIAIDGIPIHRSSELFGIGAVVFFSPEDLSLVKDGPSLRRRFMDLELCQMDRIYVRNLINYNKILNQRNRLLKDLVIHPDYIDTLEIWDMQLLRFGKEIIRKRAAFIEELAPLMQEIHGRISGGKEALILNYEPSVREEEFEDLLKKNKDADIRQRMTLIGPHRDDISFFVNQADIRKFGSQGQQRTAALALKLSEIELVRSVMKDDPILLLDDVLSELDSRRQDYLLSAIHNTQTILSCTGLDDFVNRRFEINRIFRVKKGSISPFHLEQGESMEIKQDKLWR